MFSCAFRIQIYDVTLLIATFLTFLILYLALHHGVGATMLLTVNVPRDGL